MLNGIAPVIVFVFKKEVAGVKIPYNIIPLYLDERLTGVLPDTQSRHMSVEVQNIGNTSYERTTSSDVQLMFIAKKNNIAVTAVLALFEKVMNHINKKEYSITLYYDDVFMTDASLKDFETEVEDGTDKRLIRITLSNRPEEESVTETILKKIGNAIAPF